MTNHTPVPTQDDELGYDEAHGLATEQTRRQRANKIAELRRQADGARERARKAQDRFERAVVLTASTRPDREDWYEHPGELPRKTHDVHAVGVRDRFEFQRRFAGNLNTLGLHRIMEHYRKARANGRKGKR